MDKPDFYIEGKLEDTHYVVEFLKKPDVRAYHQWQLEPLIRLREKTLKEKTRSTVRQAGENAIQQ